MSIKRLFSAFSVFTMALLLAISVLGQGTTSRVTGTVTDNNGAAVSGATVTLTNEQTQVVVSTVTTNDSGVYLFDLVQPGRYKVSVERDGFKKFESTNNTVLVNQPATVNVALEVGGVSEVVSVEATAEQVQTASSGNIGGTVEQRTIESLPIVGTRGRNPLDILNFIPGVTSGANTGGGVHINGSRDRAFNFTLDGIDINESTAGGSNFTPLRPNPDSIQEFQVVTSGFTAELGRSSGAQVTFVTRSGTNDFRGSLFEFYQSKGFMARSYPVNVNGGEKENFIQHIFGGSFSGPLFNPGFGDGTKPGWLRDKAFFFVNLQMLRASDTVLQTRTVFTPTARQGIFRWVQGSSNGTGVVDASGNPIYPNCAPGQIGTNAVRCIQSYNVASGTGIPLDTTLMNYINAMPAPNSYSATGDGLNIAGFQFNSPQTERQWDFVSKFDFKLNDENSFYIRWAQGEQNTFGDAANGGRPRFPDSGNFVDTYRTPKNLAVNWRSAPSSKFVNEFILGYSKFGFSFLTPEPDPNYGFVFNLPTDPITNFSYNARSFRTWQFVDNMTFDFSPHTIKAGANLRLGKSTDDRASVAGGAIEGAWDFSRAVTPFPSGWALPSSATGAANPINTNDRARLENMINDMLGRVGNVTQAFVSDPNNPNQFAPGGTRWLFDAKHPELDFYVQDTWRLSKRLIVDLGVRLEMRFSPTSAGGRPMLVPGDPFTLGSAPSNSITWTEGDLFGNRALILPTAGIAWDVFGDGKTSVRANYRKASDRFSTFLFSSFIFQSTPGNNALGSNRTFGENGGLLRNGLPDVFPPLTPEQYRTPTAFSTISTTAIDPDVKFPAIHNWTLSFQRELWGGNVVEVNYIGKKATNLFGAYNVNQADIFGSVAGINENFLQAFNSIRGDSTYNSPLINYLFTGNVANNAGTARFRSLNSTNITQGSVASVALATSQKTCVTADVTAGVCTNAQLGQRILELTGNRAFFQPFSQFTGGFNVIDSNDYSFYNGLEISVKRRMRQGVSFNIGYTWAVSKDTRSFDPVFTTVSGGSVQSAGNTPLDPSDRSANYAWSDFDRRHSLLGTYVVELPFGSGKKFRAGNSVLNYMISGWQVAGTLRVTSGRPFTVYAGVNTLSSVRQSYANCDGCPRDMGAVVQGNFENTANPNTRNWWWTPDERNRFSQPDPGEAGNAGRNYFIGPAYRETDISLLRKFKIRENMSFDIRVDAKNLTNTPNFIAPSSVLPANFDTAGFGSSIFGRINADVANNARRIQLSGRFNF